MSRINEKHYLACTLMKSKLQTCMHELSELQTKVNLQSRHTSCYFSSKLNLHRKLANFRGVHNSAANSGKVCKFQEAERARLEQVL
jgi:hypothetical protein